MQKIQLANQVMQAFNFLGIAPIAYQILVRKHTLAGLHSKLGCILNGENVTL